MLVDDPGIGVVGSIEILMRFKCLGNWREYRIKMSMVRKGGILTMDKCIYTNNFPSMILSSSSFNPCYYPVKGSTYRPSRCPPDPHIDIHYSAACAIRTISLAISSGERIKSIHPLAIALCGISGCPAVSGFCAMVMPPTSFIPHSASAPSPS